MEEREFDICCQVSYLNTQPSGVEGVRAGPPNEETLLYYTDYKAEIPR